MLFHMGFFRFELESYMTTGLLPALALMLDPSGMAGKNVYTTWHLHLPNV
jgi:hypothetical protein